MKRLRLGLAAMSLAAAVWGTPSLNAHEADEHSAKGAAHEEGPQGGEKRWDKMKEELGLSGAQMDKLKESHKGMRESMQASAAKLKTDLATLKGLVDKKGPDTDLTAAIEALKGDRDAMETQRKKEQEVMRGILTPLQQAKLILKMGDHIQGGMGMGPGMGRGKGMGHGKGMRDGDKEEEGKEDSHSGEHDHQGGGD